MFYHFSASHKVIDVAQDFVVWKKKLIKIFYAVPTLLQHHTKRRSWATTQVKPAGGCWEVACDRIFCRRKEAAVVEIFWTILVQKILR